MKKLLVVTVAAAAPLVGCGATTSEPSESPGIVDHLLGRPGANDGDAEQEPPYCDIGRQVDEAHTALHAGAELAPWGGPSGVAVSVRLMAKLFDDENLAAAARDVAAGLEAVSNGAGMDETFSSEPLERSATELFAAIDQCRAGETS